MTSIPFRPLMRLGLALAVLLAPLPSPGRPALAQTETPAAALTATRAELDLNGTWTFTPLDGTRGPGVPTAIRVPDAWDGAPGFSDTTSAVYERAVSVPAEWAGREVWLEIYEANWHVDVTVNGTAFTRLSEGIGVPTNLNITSAVQFGASNTLKIKVTQAGLAYAKDRPAGTFRWEQNRGLTGDVFLRSYPTVRVADAFVKTSVRQGQLSAVYELTNRTGAARTLTVTPRVLELDGTPVRDLPAQSVSVGAGLTAALTIAQAWANPRLWSPPDPHLYYLETTLTENGALVDVQRVRFGFREVWTQGADLLLNGVPITLFADSNDLFQHAFLNYYYTLWYDAATTRATTAKLLQARNAIRIHQAPAPRPHVLEIFDELGVLVIAESAVYGGSYSNGYGGLAASSQSWSEGVAGLSGPEGLQALTTYIDNAVQWIPKWIRRERNHPSIIIWSAENELGPGWLNQNEAQLKRLGDKVRELDATRPVIFEGDHACCGSDFNSFHYNQDGPGNDWPADNDVYAYAALNFSASRPNSHNEYAFTGWNGNGIFEFKNVGSPPAALFTSLQGTRLRAGLLTRGYRYQGWATLAPHTFIWQWADFYGPEGRVEDAFVARSFQPVAAFDVDYDKLGENPAPPVIPAGAAAFTRKVVVYNQEYGGPDAVTLVVEARSDGASAPFYTYSQAHTVARGRKLDVNVTIPNLPAGSHWIQLTYKVIKAGVERFTGETRDFQRDGADSAAPAAPAGLRASASGGPLGVLDRNMVYLTWDLPQPRGDLAGWVISRGTSPNPTGQEDEVKLWGEREKFDAFNEYFDVVPGAGTYYYRVRAKDLKGNLSAYSAPAVVTVVDFETPVRDPGFELESRLSKDLNNQYAASRPWGAAWPLPAIHGGSRAAPHGGRYAGLINGDGAQAPNAFVDKFTFKQRAPRVAKAFHVGAYFRIDRVWRARTGTGVWPEPGLRLAVVGGDGSGYFYNPFQDVLIDLPTLAQWAGDGQWHYVYFTMNTPPADNDGQFEIVVRDGEGDADWREPLVDAYVDDLVFAPVDKVPPAALARRVGSGEVRAGDAVSLSAAGSFGFNAGGAALSPGSGLSYVWDLGNGQTASGPAVNTVYGAPGEYVARVTVTDQKGLASTAQVFITVLPATERLAATPSLAHQGDNVLLTLTLTGDGGPLTAALPLPAELNYVSHTATCAPAPAYDAGARQLTYAGQPAAGAACQIAVTTQVATSQVRALTVAATFSKSGGPAQPLTVDLLLNPAQVWLPSVSR